MSEQAVAALVEATQQLMLASQTQQQQLAQLNTEFSAAWRETNTAVQQLTKTVDDQRLAAEERFTIKRELMVQSGLKPATIQYQSAKKPAELYGWFRHVETVTQGAQIDLNTKTGKARVCGYFTGDLAAWWSMQDEDLLALPWPDFKKKILDAFGLFTAAEMTFSTLLTLVATRSSDYARYLQQFNSILSLLRQETPGVQSDRDKLTEVTMFRRGLPEALLPASAEYTGKDLGALQDHLRGRLTRDPLLAERCGYDANLNAPTPMDLGLGVVTPGVNAVTATPAATVATVGTNSNATVQTNFVRGRGRSRFRSFQPRRGQYYSRGRGNNNFRGYRPRFFSRGRSPARRRFSRFNSRGNTRSNSRSRDVSPNRRTQSRSRTPDPRSRQRMDMDVGPCFECGEFGHIARDCTRSKNY